MPLPSRGSALARVARCTAAVLMLGFAAAPVAAQAPSQGALPPEEDLVHLDLPDVELSVVIGMISEMTGTNFIYDDRVRGRRISQIAAIFARTGSIR